MSISSVSSVSTSSLAAPYALVRAVDDSRAAADAALRQSREDTDNKISELTAQARAAAAQDRQADAARQQASMIQATSGRILDVYA